MKPNSKGGVLVKLLNILAIAAIWLIVALPVLVNSQIKANEQAVILKIQRISEACEKFKILNKSYPKDLESLIAFIHEDMVSPGYIFVYNCPNLNEYMLLASPKHSGLTGQSGFYADNGQNILKVQKDLVPSISNAVVEKRVVNLPPAAKAILTYSNINTPAQEISSGYAAKQHRQDIPLVPEAKADMYIDTFSEKDFDILVANLEATTASFYDTSSDIVKHSYSPLNTGSNGSASYINSGYIHEPDNNPPLKQKQTPEFPVKPSQSVTQGKETGTRTNN